VLLPRGQNNSKGASLSLSYNTIFIDAAKISQLFFLNWGFMPKHGNIAERWLVERSHLVERKKNHANPLFPQEMAMRHHLFIIFCSEQLKRRKK